MYREHLKRQYLAQGNLVGVSPSEEKLVTIKKRSDGPNQSRGVGKDTISKPFLGVVSWFHNFFWGGGWKLGYMSTLS